MPVNLSIKNVPDHLAEKLREQAKHHHRSLQGELMTILEEVIASRRLTLDELVQRVKERGVLTGDESVSMIREDRDAH